MYQGKFKTDTLKSRVYDINPDAQVNAIQDFVRKDNIDQYINKAANFNVLQLLPFIMILIKLQSYAIIFTS